jgi:hypothetical protein
MLEASSLEKLDGIVEGVESLMGRVQLSDITGMFTPALNTRQRDSGYV